MLDRYRTLFSELKILEYQLRRRAKEVKGIHAGFRIKAGRRGFVRPEVFKDIIEGKK